MHTLNLGNDLLWEHFTRRLIFSQNINKTAACYRKILTSLLLFFL